MGYNDFFERAARIGSVGAVTSNRASKSLTTAMSATNLYTVFDKNIDEEWAKGYRTSKAPHSYFDYYFSGQDILVGIDGVEDEFGTIPIINLGFNMTQQKTPVFGAFSYTYDAVMRGNRIVTGEFSIATTSPDYMKNLLAKAATSRANRSYTPYSTRPLTEDDANIEKYWGRVIDPDYGNAGKRIFSVHPPFSFLILYGVQNISLGEATSSSGADILDGYASDNPLYSDQNERLVESDSADQASRIVLEACELTSMATSYTPDGAVCSETYQFFGRDYIIPPRRTGNTTQHGRLYY